MATAKQVAANRLNAQKSTGAKSVEGKAKVSQNRLSHGLCSAFRVLSYESQEHFEHLISQLTSDQKPVGALETELIRKMAEAMWMRDRAVQLHNASFSVERTPEQIRNNQVEVEMTESLDHFLRYEAHQDRIFRRALADLLKLQKQRGLREIGFERQQRAQAEETRRAKREEREARREKLDKVRFMTACVDMQTKKEKLIAYQAANGSLLTTATAA